MKMKSIICGAMSLSSMMLMASDTPEVSDVVMAQASFGRLVTVTYKLSNAANGAVVTFDVETNCTVNGETKWASIGGEAVCNAQGAVWRKVTSSDADSEGKYTITWRPDLSWEGHKVTLAEGGARAVVTAWALDNTPDYMVVDISAAAQPNTQKYYPGVEYLPGGVQNSLYKTTKLLMRKIMAKGVEWTMGSTTLETQNRLAAREATHLVTLTNNYYIGVYEVTQSQWSQVATNSTISANFTTERFMRPMEKVCYNEIRNAANTTTANASYNWPNDPNPSSFLGLLRSKTGLDFDLPSEAQWEFAARAGNGVGYWNDGTPILNANPDDNLKLLGRYERNGGKVLRGTSYVDPAASCGVTNGTAIVGSYLPNSWGLYDMHGNVWEWCLDWWAQDISTTTGSVNQDSSSGYRIIRGGSYNTVAGSCRPACRYINRPGTASRATGARVVCTAGLR